MNSNSTLYEAGYNDCKNNQPMKNDDPNYILGWNACLKAWKMSSDNPANWILDESGKIVGCRG